MKRSFVDRFFRELDREWRRPAEVILTGAVAGSLFGHVRPSVDIDFEIRAARRTGGLLGDVIRRISEKTGVTVNYAEDISHGSMISYLDYRRKALPYKRIGRLEIQLMAPRYWTIGKMARFLELDIRDLVEVIRKKGLSADGLARLWGKALARSPLSLASGQFRDHVIYFFERYGKSVWGKGFDGSPAVRSFKKSAGWK